MTPFSFPPDAQARTQMLAQLLAKQDTRDSAERSLAALGDDRSVNRAPPGGTGATSRTNGGV